MIKRTKYIILIQTGMLRSGCVFDKYQPNLALLTTKTITCILFILKDYKLRSDSMVMANYHGLLGFVIILGDTNRQQDTRNSFRE